MQSDTAHTPESQKWFRNPMVWLVIFFPSLAVVAGIATLFIAIDTEDSLVDDNYYKKGLEINRVIALDNKAKSLGLNALANINTLNGKVSIGISSEKPQTLPSSLLFKLTHRTRTGLDQQTHLNLSAKTGKFEGYLKPPIIKGRWTVNLQSEDQWRLKKNIDSGHSEHIILQLSPL